MKGNGRSQKVYPLSSMHSSKRPLPLLGLLLLAFAGWWAHGFRDQDRCLNAGGCWDEIRGECEYEEQPRCVRPDDSTGTTPC